MQASLDLGEFPSEEPIGSFYIDVEWVESCFSVGENGPLGKDPNIRELKMFKYFASCKGKSLVVAMFSCLL